MTETPEETSGTSETGETTTAEAPVAGGYGFQVPIAASTADARSRTPRTTLVAWVVLAVVVLSGLGVGAFFVGRSTNHELSKARAAGAREGQVVGERSGRHLGQAQGARRVYRATYGSAYRRAYRSAYENTMGG
jgi:hypothetical protein